MIDEVLARLAARLEAIGGIQTAQVWDGAWDPALSARRASFAPPAAMVSLLQLRLPPEGISRAGWTAGELLAPEERQRAAGAARPLPDPPPPTLQPQLQLAVTIVTAGGAAPERAAKALALAGPVLQVVVADAWTEVQAQNLYSEKLYGAGMTAVAVTGWRRIELAAPPAAAPREEPAAVAAAVGGGPPQPVYPAPEAR